MKICPHNIVSSIKGPLNKLEWFNDAQGKLHCRKKTVKYFFLCIKLHCKIIFHYWLMTIPDYLYALFFQIKYVPPFCQSS